MRKHLTEEQKEIEKIIKKLCEDKLNQNVFLEDEKSIFNREKWDSLGKIGLYALPFDEQYGGLNADMKTTAHAIKSLGKYCKDEGIVFSACAQIAAIQVPIWLYGTEEQKETFLAPLMSGEKIGASVISEPEAGSHLSQLKTRIEKENDAFRLNGVKTFATLAPEADILLVYGKHPNGIRMLDVSAFLLEKGEYKIGQIFEKAGLRTSPMSEVILENVLLSRKRLLGTERKGMEIFMKAMIWEKILVSAYHLGVMEQQYSEVYAYSCSRKQFNQHIIEFESIANRLTDMRMRIETSRLMLYDVCEQFDEGKIEPSLSAMVKLHTSEAKLKNSLDAIHIMGAYGIIKENMIEKQMRDALAAKIYSGTSDMQRKILFDKLGDLSEE